METKKLSFGEAIASCFKKFACFRGRARRSEFWYWYMFSIIVYLSIGIMIWYFIYGFYIGVICLSILFLPNLAVSVRRLHDVGRSGWWLLSPLGAFGFWGGILCLFEIPCWELLVLSAPICWPLQLLCLLRDDSEKQENRYGKSPKYVDSTEETLTPDEQALS
ncbi:MAG: DUF805 domain-containing protein [Bacteroides sp.]|nr:DUF805 domain-containing protein [Bacteroides sp.]MCM1086029.1 DUF805 domain-containing protein [Bacteroides sp.]